MLVVGKESSVESRIKKIKYIVALAIFKVRSCLNKNRIKVIDIDGTIEELITGSRSLVRFGDGEISLIRGYGIRFQPYSKEIQRDLIGVLESNEDDIMIAIPAHVANYDYIKYYRKDERVAWVKESFYSYNVYKNSCKNKIYYNSLVSRLYLPFDLDYTVASRRFKEIRKLWNNKKILIVEGQYSRLGVGNDLFDNVNKRDRILCPSKDAYSKLTEIENEIEWAMQREKYDLVLLALGPTAKVIVYHLHKLGRMIDLGHIDVEYEWFLKKTRDKVAIKGKAVNEAINGYSNLQLHDEKYESEILKTIM